MHWAWKWTIVFLVVGLVDYGVRWATRFNMDWVVPLEAVLFFGSSFLFWQLTRRNPAQVPWQHTVQLVVVASFVLGGVRSALWALGLPVSRANLIILVLGVALVAWRWRHKGQAAA
jgi:hypothetical protein